MSGESTETKVVNTTENLTALALKTLSKAAPQIFKRDGSVKKCPRNQIVKKSFVQLLKDYNMVKNGLMDNLKYGVPLSISLCAKDVSVTLTGALAEIIITHPNDILAEILGNGWIVC